MWEKVTKGEIAIVVRNLQANHSRHHCNLGVHPGKSERGSNLSLVGTLPQRIKPSNEFLAKFFRFCTATDVLFPDRGIQSAQK